MLRRHAPPSPPTARARELRAPHAPAPCTHAPRRTPGPAGPPRGIATGITGISGAIIGFGLPQLKRASRPGGGLSGKSMRPARPPGLAESLRDAPAHVPDCQANAKRKRKRMLMLMLALGWRSLALREETVFEPAKTGLEPAYPRLQSRRLAVTQRTFVTIIAACCQNIDTHCAHSLRCTVGVLALSINLVLERSWYTLISAKGEPQPRAMAAYCVLRSCAWPTSGLESLIAGLPSEVA